MSAINGKNPGPPAAPQVRVIENRTIFAFGFDVVDEGDFRTLIIDTPDGKRMSLPFSKDAAQTCGKKLCAPSVVMPLGQPRRG